MAEKAKEFDPIKQGLLWWYKIAYLITRYPVIIHNIETSWLDKDKPLDPNEPRINVVEEEDLTNPIRKEVQIKATRLIDVSELEEILTLFEKGEDYSSYNVEILRMF